MQERRRRNRTMTFISRWWQSLGFGIQSKTDYAFLHDVLRERTPYYAYDDMLKAFPKSTVSEHVTARLLLRVCNSVQPSKVRVYGDVPQLYVAAIRHGCGSAEVECNKAKYFKLHCADMSDRLTGGVLVELIAGSGGHDCIAAVVLTDIDTYNTHLWKQLCSLPVITYDMRNTGVAVMRDGRYPEHYKLSSLKL